MLRSQSTKKKSGSGVKTKLLILPGIMLKRLRRLSLVCRKFNRLALEAHFQHNTQIGFLEADGKPTTPDKTVAERWWQDIREERDDRFFTRTAFLSCGTFNFHPVFLTNVKRLTIVPAGPHVEQALGRQIRKIKQILMLCSALKEVTVNIQHLWSEWEVRIKQGLEMVVGELNAQEGSPRKVVLKIEGEANAYKHPKVKWGVVTYHGRGTDRLYPQSSWFRTNTLEERMQADKKMVKDASK